MLYGAALLLGYFIGSIPFGLVLCKLFGYGDIRKIGSGNIGATNVLRTGNKPLALVTLLLDSGKGAIAVIAALIVFSNTCEFIYCITDPCPCMNYPVPVAFMAFLAGAGAIVGHCFPIWLKFKGGKGVATTLGTLLMAVPLAGLTACLIWLLSAVFSKISSLAAITAMLIAPVAVYFFYNAQAAYISAAISVLVIIKHHTNIKRIMNGTEPKIGKKKNSESA